MPDDDRPNPDDEASHEALIEEVLGPTPTLEDLRRAEISERVAEISLRRAVIEQVKGMLSMAYGVDADEAFKLLQWRSQVTNVKLRALAEQLFVEFRAARVNNAMPTQATVDGIFMTAHERIPRPPVEGNSSI